MPLTVTIADDLANQLRPYETQLSAILALGIREWQARKEIGYNGVNSVLEQLAALPTLEEVLVLRPSPALQQRIDVLLEKKRSGSWSAEETLEWEQIQYLEHLMRMAKANAANRLRGAKA